MKKIIFTLCLLAGTYSLFAQAHLTFKIGANFDYQEFVNHDSVTTEKLSPFKRLGGHFGMAADIPLYEDIISFSPEVQFSGKAAVGELFDNVVGEIQVPLLFTCYITTTFGVDLGPSINYEIFNFVKTANDWEKNIPITEPLDFGVAGGARFKITDNATILGRFYFGLRDLLKSDALANFSPYNRSIQISYLYSGGGRGY